jgi:phosphoglycerate kinase
LTANPIRDAADDAARRPREDGSTMTSTVTTPPALRRLRSVRDANVVGKSVLVRADLNAPLSDRRVADDTRIRAAVPTLELLRHRGAARITVCSHLGRPKRPDPAFAIAPVATRLHELFAGPLTVLENTRFDPGETANDIATARRLVAGCDLFVEDAFGSVHRAHASTVGTAQLLPAYAGLLVEAEVAHLGRLLGEVRHPYVVVVGGAKADDKLSMLAHLGALADTVLVGGRLAEQLRVAGPGEIPVELPVDVVAAERFDAEAPRRVFAVDEIPYGWTPVDIGPRTRRRYARVLSRARTVFWNGPVGVFEWPGCGEGTETVANAIAWSGAYSVAGGGDTLRALHSFGVADRMSWLSTGGGASLELLAGDELPGLAAIPSA